MRVTLASVDSELRQLGILPELSALDLFCDFSEAEIEGLCKNGKIVVSDHKTVLFGAGDPADFYFVVLSGAFKLVKPKFHGDDAIVHFSVPGDVLAAFVMTQENPRYPLSAVSMGPSRALKIPRVNYISEWKNKHTLVFRIQNLLSSRMVSLQRQKALSKSPLQAKVASLLMELASREVASSELTIPIPLTRKEIADTVGATVESVIRIMSDWSKKGYVMTSDQQITILEASELIELMGAEF